jgi:ribosomal protein S19E (S16A)
MKYLIEILEGKWRRQYLKLGQLLFWYHVKNIWWDDMREREREREREQNQKNWWNVRVTSSILKCINMYYNSFYL